MGVLLPRGLRARRREGYHHPALIRLASCLALWETRNRVSAPLSLCSGVLRKETRFLCELSHPHPLPLRVHPGAPLAPDAHLHWRCAPTALAQHASAVQVSAVPVSAGERRDPRHAANGLANRATAGGGEKENPPSAPHPKGGAMPRPCARLADPTAARARPPRTSTRPASPRSRTSHALWVPAFAGTTDIP